MDGWHTGLMENRPPVGLHDSAFEEDGFIVTAKWGPCKRFALTMIAVVSLFYVRCTLQGLLSIIF